MLGYKNCNLSLEVGSKWTLLTQSQEYLVLQESDHRLRVKELLEVCGCRGLLEFHTMNFNHSDLTGIIIFIYIPGRIIPGKLNPVVKTFPIM